MITYLKNNFLKIGYFFSIFAVVNLILLTSTPIQASAVDILYLDFLLLFISLLFLIIDYRKWKNTYSELLDAIHKGTPIEAVLQDINTSFEIQLIKEIVQLKNKEMEKNVKSVKQNLEEVNDYIMKWVHEIKTPIAVCELIADKIEENNPANENHRLSEELRLEIERIKFLIHQVLYTSRSASYAEDLQISEINIERLIKDIIKSNAQLFIAKKIEIKLGHLHYDVMSDKKWLSYIINQIINNACKYVGQGGKIEIRAEENEKLVRLHIKDNGIGISEKDISRIFDKGFTGENGRKIARSTGMGLYLSQKMAHKLRHDIFVSSKEGSFTELTLVFYKLSDYFKAVVQS
ncbi:sensor histidine kinase [Bacillaceae bacterium Marseille-Q3522]|nr:sensor histidine kinase [Bacillaceae bacterium Marseille-Q3522]